MKILINVLRRAEFAMRVMAAFCLVGMALMTGADVVGRGLFNAPIFGSEEIVAILAVIAVGFSLPYAHSQRVHIGVELLMIRMSNKVQTVVKILTDLTATVLFAIVTWRMALYAGTLERSGVVSMNLELPEYMVVYALAFGFGVFALRLVMDVVQFSAIAQYFNEERLGKGAE